MNATPTKSSKQSTPTCVNLSSGSQYSAQNSERLINAMLERKWAEDHPQAFKVPLFCGFAQVAKYGGSVKKGSRAFKIIVPQSNYGGNRQRRSYVSRAVFHISQCEFPDQSRVSKLLAEFIKSE